MQINQQELAEAVETISEGGQALGVSCEDVYLGMAKDEDFIIELMKNVHFWRSLESFDSKFDSIAASMLTEALRAKKEVDNGLL